MLLVVTGEQAARAQIVIYIMLLPIMHATGTIYLISAIGLGAILIVGAWQVWKLPGQQGLLEHAPLAEHVPGLHPPSP